MAPPPETAVRADRSWSPFARPRERGAASMAEALLEAADREGCAVEDLTPVRYDLVRRRHPELGLPPVTTIKRECDSWEAALDVAAAYASAILRRAFARRA